MKSEWRVFGIVAGFLFAACAVYYAWTASTEIGPDWVGSMGLLLAGLLCLMCGGYFWFVSRRIDPRPEDRDDAEIADGAGEIGFFSPSSYWPVGLAGACLLAGIGIVYMFWWLIALGIAAVLLGTGGLLFEYYTGARRAEH